MKKVAVILGGGASLADYKRESFSPDVRILACNNVAGQFDDITDVVCADRYGFIVKERPNALRKDVPLHVQESWGDWEAVARRMPNVQVHKAKKWGGQFKESPTENLWSGVHTPFFAACLALHEGATELHFFGIDCTNHTDGAQRSIIREFNYLAKFADVYLPSSSELWALAEKHGMKLDDVKSVAYPLPPASDAPEIRVLDAFDEPEKLTGTGIDGYDFPPDYGNEPVIFEAQTKKRKK